MSFFKFKEYTKQYTNSEQNIVLFICILEILILQILHVEEKIFERKLVKSQDFDP